MTPLAMPAPRAEGGPADGMVSIPAGRFLMGSDGPEANPGDDEGPVREVAVRAFLMDETAVSNAAFAAFVQATGYVTTAERLGWSFVFIGQLPQDFPPTRGVADAPWWRQVQGAHWRHPEGLHSSPDGRLDHPVVHVSWLDACSFCTWAGKRLSAEREWEYAARGGFEQKAYPWGDELTPDGEHRMNVWQGRFPGHNTGEDGYMGTAPVHAYLPNSYGLFQMTGNVWEWCAEDFRGPLGHKAMRGGSYLCHSSYCNRYRVSARSGSMPDSSAGNVGFRGARDAG